jgi:hypothetical protein
MSLESQCSIIRHYPWVPPPIPYIRTTSRETKTSVNPKLCLSNALLAAFVDCVATLFEPEAVNDAVLTGTPPEAVPDTNEQPIVLHTKVPVPPGSVARSLLLMLYTIVSVRVRVPYPDVIRGVIDVSGLPLVALVGLAPPEADGLDVSDAGAAPLLSEVAGEEDGAGATGVVERVESCELVPPLDWVGTAVLDGGIDVGVGNTTGLFVVSGIAEDVSALGEVGAGNDAGAATLSVCWSVRLGAPGHVNVNEWDAASARFWRSLVGAGAAALLRRGCSAAMTTLAVYAISEAVVQLPSGLPSGK